MTGRSTALALVSATLLCAAPLPAESEAAAANSRTDSSRATEEVVVRGQRLSDFRNAIEASRERVYALFNALNTDDVFDVSCRREAATGTQHVCRPQFRLDTERCG